jgi:hypothetical protein
MHCAAVWARSAVAVRAAKASGVQASVAPRRKRAGRARGRKELVEVRFRDQIEKHLLVLSFSGFDPEPTSSVHRLSVELPCLPVTLAGTMLLV